MDDLTSHLKFKNEFSCFAFSYQIFLQDILVFKEMYHLTRNKIIRILKVLKFANILQI